ncbi:MAG: molybdopterin-dependent oxidoreductase [Actinomycetota bacterium]|nr:molybdopterin-dependent oxidoreductase [Actinomycetota bacterium]
MTAIAEPPGRVSGAVGRGVPNVEWNEKTSGEASYAGDIDLPGMLHARILRSPHAHARIRGIDLSGAQAMPTVVAMVTSAHVPDRTYIHHGGPLSDRRVLAKGVVRFVGEEVVGVAATSPAEAALALTRIKVDYQPLPAALTPAAAVADGAPLIHPGGNVPVRHVRRWGIDPEALEHEVRVKGDYRFGPQTHACMETNTVTASWDRIRGVLDVWISTQSPYLVRKELAHVLDLDVEAIHIHEVAVGGGFGSKSKISEYEAIACALSMSAERPVRLALSREEEFTTAKCRHGFEVSLETSASAEGLLTGRTATVRVDNGAYNHSGPSVMGYAGQVLGSLYRIPSVKVDAELVYTNKQPGGQFRGYGGPQAIFALESQMDELADKLGMDPIDLRILNANHAGDTTLTGWRIDSARLVECLTTARDAIGWTGRGARAASGRGIGFAAAIHVSGANIYEGADKSSATIDVGSDGSVLLKFGAADAGTWQNTIVAQFVAEELCIEPETVRLLTMETDSTPTELGSWSSRGTYMSGHSVGETAREVAAALREAGASLLDVRVDDVWLEGGTVTDGTHSAPFADIVSARFGGLLTRTREVTLSNVDPVNRETGVANISGAYSFAVHAAEVSVDEGTGRVRVERYVAVHDSGRIINPIAARSQVVGGVAMGIGYALSEELLYEGGKSMTRSYIQYPLPRAADIPTIEVVFVEGDDPHGPYGAKAIGEIVLVPPGAAIANAVADASGVRLRELPLSPDRVVAGIRARDSSPRRSYRIGRRPSRWQIAAMRAWYPRGLHWFLHRFGTRWARPLPMAQIRSVQRVTDEASLSLALASPGATLIAGGTDLLPARRQGLAQPEVLVDVLPVIGLGRIEERDDGIAIGAAVRLTDAGTWAAEHLPVLRSAIDGIATDQVRNMATVGGNLCQGNRCWFLRNDFMCYKRGGVTCPCYAVTGDHRYYHAVIDAHRCQSVTPSDLATVLTALDASVEIGAASGRRIVRVADLYHGPGEVRLAKGEYLRSVLVDPTLFDGHDYRKLNRGQGDFAMISVAVSVALTEGRTVDRARVVFGAMAPIPFRVTDTEDLLVGRDISSIDLASASRAWVRRAHPLKGNDWKVDAASALLRRSLAAAIAGAQATGGRP